MCEENSVYYWLYNAVYLLSENRKNKSFKKCVQLSDNSTIYGRTFKLHSESFVKRNDLSLLLKYIKTPYPVVYTTINSILL